MTPTETTTILRQFNEWRRGDEDLPQPGPKQITAAIYAAVEMIESLEALRAELKAAHAMALNGVEWRELAKKYEAKIEAMERQEPYAFAVNFPDSSRVELVHDLDDLCDDMTNEAHEVRKLYLAPGAQPAPSVPEGWKLVPIEPTHEMLDAGEDTFVPTYTGTPVSAPIDVYRAMLAAAPEAKP